jgi:hypothetical protein
LIIFMMPRPEQWKCRILDRRARRPRRQIDGRRQLRWLVYDGIRDVSVDLNDGLVCEAGRILI